MQRSFQAFGTAYFVMPDVAGMALDSLIKEPPGKPFSGAALRELAHGTLKLDKLFYVVSGVVAK